MLDSMDANMAGDIVICELLCFLRKNFDKLPVSQLKPTLVSFYTEDEVINAKDIMQKAVLSAVKDAGVDFDLPQLPERRGDNKGKQTVDDILKLMTIADERNLIDYLPRYVAVTRIPFVNADSMSVISMARKMETLEQRMFNMEMLINKSGVADIAERQAELSCTEQSERDSISDPVEITNPYPWTKVTYQKASKKGIRTTARTPANQSILVEGVTGRNDPVDKRAVRQKMIGVRPNNDGTSLKTGVTIQQKAVVHIDNLDPDCNEALLQDYLLVDDISVITCFQVKSWLRGDEKDKVTAFRVCIPAAQRHLIFNTQLWSQGIVIRDWKFRRSSNDGRA